MAERSEHIERVLARMDWKLLAEQKLTLVKLVLNPRHAPEIQEHLDGLLHFLDGVQDAAALDGNPVVWLDEDDERHEHAWKTDEDNLEVCTVCGVERGEEETHAG